jgi:hypothetical protein
MNRYYYRVRNMLEARHSQYVHAVRTRAAKRWAFPNARGIAARLNGELSRCGKEGCKISKTASKRGAHQTPQHILYILHHLSSPNGPCCPRCQT